MRDDGAFFTTLAKHFDPYTATSGTEAMAHLLYAMVLMIRPLTVVEYGPGHTTMFLLKALAENTSSERAERDALLRKTADTGVLDAVPEKADDDRTPWPEAAKAAYRGWLYADGPACTAGPAFYLAVHEPRLYGFEALPTDHAYSSKVRDAVSALGLGEFFEPHYDEGFSPQHLPADSLPVDLAWNDCDDYRAFFEEFWEKLKPNGGVMIFHNATAWTPLYQDILWMRRNRGPRKPIWSY